MDDEVLARLAALVGVVLAGEDEGVDHPAAVDLAGDLVGVLLDDREEVGEQLALGLGEVGGRLGGRAGLVVVAVDGPMTVDGDVLVPVPVRDGRDRGGRRRLLVLVCHVVSLPPKRSSGGSERPVVSPW